MTEKILNFRKYVPLIAIVVLAGFLRTYQTGTEFFGGDDAYISIKAVQIARYGETHLLGPPSSLGLVHSPLSVYLYAIPYLISPDPVGAQMFTGLMNTLAVAILYLITLRYFGMRAAIIASLLAKIPLPEIKKSLFSFEGVKRRFTFLGKIKFFLYKNILKKMKIIKNP